MRLHAVARGATAELEHPAAMLFQFRDGKLRHLELHIDRDRALREFEAS